MNTPQIVGQFQKNSREAVRVTRSEYNGHPQTDIRVYVTGKDGDPVPTKKGICIRPELVRELIELLEKADCDE